MYLDLQTGAEYADFANDEKYDTILSIIWVPTVSFLDSEEYRYEKS